MRGGAVNLLQSRAVKIKQSHCVLCVLCVVFCDDQAMMIMTVKFFSFPEKDVLTQIQGGKYSYNCRPKYRNIYTKRYKNTYTYPPSLTRLKTVKGARRQIRVGAGGRHQSCEMSILFHRAKPSNQILPQEKSVNRDNFGIKRIPLENKC